jgi:hypothetical protein
VDQDAACGDGQERAAHADGRDRAERGPEAGPADVHAAVEQDAHQGHRDHPLDDQPGRFVQRRDGLDRDGRADQDERGRWDLHPFGQPVREHGDQSHRRREQQDQGKGLGVGHDGCS